MCLQVLGAHHVLSLGGVGMDVGQMTWTEVGRGGEGGKE